MTKFSEQERARIIAEARRHIADRPAIEADLARRLQEIPVEEPVRKWRREQDELEASRVQERAQPEREVRYSQPVERKTQDEPQGWDAWNRWCDERIRAALESEREYLLTVLAETVAELMRRQSRDERREAKRAVKETFEAELQALRVEVANLEATLAELGKIIASEKARVVDLPSLSRARDRDLN